MNYIVPAFPNRYNHSIEGAKTYAHSFNDDVILDETYKWAEIIDKETLKVVASCFSFEDEADETLWDILEDGDKKWW